MRKIKFRAWNKETEQFELPTYRGVANLNINDILRGSTLLYQQFTGLHDKNGKEIYEGDIIYWGNEIAPMEWIEKWACFCLYNEGSKDRHRFPQEADAPNLEVIGNIYENKELLNAS